MQKYAAGHGEEQRVDAVEHAAVAAEQRARVLHLHVPLEHRLEQVAERRRDREHGAEHDRLGDREEVLLVERDEGDEDRRGRAERRSPPTSCPARRVGAMRWRPSSRPPTYASVSPAQTASSTVNAARRPCSGRSRSSSMNASPQPIQTAPITVAEIDAVAAWRVAAMPFSAKASTSDVSAPPTIQRRVAELRRRASASTPPT